MIFLWLIGLSAIAIALCFRVIADAERIDRLSISVDLALEAMEAVLDHEEAERQALIGRIRKGRQLRAEGGERRE